MSLSSDINNGLNPLEVQHTQGWRHNNTINTAECIRSMILESSIAAREVCTRYHTQHIYAADDAAHLYSGYCTGSISSVNNAAAAGLLAPLVRSRLRAPILSKLTPLE